MHTNPSNVSPPLTPRYSSTAMNILERVHSSRRPSQASDAAGDGDLATDDESKTKKHSHLSLAIARASHFFYRNVSSSTSSVGWCLWPCVLLCISVFLITSLVYHSRNLVCISPYDPVSRVNFFGLDGLDSDFGALGVPWCKFLLGFVDQL